MSLSEALAFDMYGTLVDPIRIWKQLEQYIPQNAQRIAEIWRQKQLEFTFRLTAMHRYEDFEQVTRKALDYALAAAGHDLDSRQKDSLMARYNDLERFADVEPGLQRLKDAGYTMVVLSNGNIGTMVRMRDVVVSVVTWLSTLGACATLEGIARRFSDGSNGNT